MTSTYLDMAVENNKIFVEFRYLFRFCFFKEKKQRAIRKFILNKQNKKKKQEEVCDSGI